MEARTIIARARALTGLDDIGDPAMIEGLKHLVEASNGEAALSAAGAARWEGALVGHLANRLRVVDYLKRRPKLLERPISRPMFVFGLPRTGTTFTINLLAADPARRCLLRWESLNPAPPAAAGALASDPRCVAEQERIDHAMKVAPQIGAAHYESADGPSECQFAMAMCFCSQLFDSNADMPSYRRWLFATDHRPALRFHKQLLQLLQENNGGRWTLKNPWHPLWIDALKEVYPDAQLVMTHRDPVEVVGSACSLIRLVRPMFSDRVDLPAIAAQMLETFELMIARQEAFRAAHGADSIHDILYAGQQRDPIGEMRRLYARFDEPFTAAAEAGMRCLLAEQPKGRHGRHEYSLEEFGLDAGDIRRRFAGYCERYAIPTT